jgi:hypothetical protein
VSLEQLIFLVLFLVLPLIQAIRRGRSRPAGDELEREEEEPRWAGPREPPAYEPPVYQPPVYQPPVHQPPVHQPPVYQPPVYQQRVPVPPVHPAPVYAHEVPSLPQRAAAAPTPRRPERKTQKPKLLPARAEPRLRSSVVPRDRKSQRRAMVLMAVFGPPRALDRS